MLGAVVRLRITTDRRVAILYQNDAFGEDGMRRGIDALNASGIQPVMSRPVSEAMMDSAALAKIAEDVLRANAGAVLMFSDSVNVGGFDNRAPHGDQSAANSAFPRRNSPDIETNMPCSTLYARRVVRRTRTGLNATGHLPGWIQLIAAITKLSYQPGDVAVVATDNLCQLRDRER